MKNKLIIIETTYPNLVSAKKLAKILLTKNLAICIEFVKIQSTYIWQKKLVEDKEILLRIKASERNYFAIEKTILSEHKYELPQIIAINIDQGLNSYFSWAFANK